MALNKVLLIGNVGNDPEIRYLDSNPQSPQGNAKVASFRLATTERYRDRSGETRENTEWHNIVAWRNNADLVEKYVHKGSQIFIEGKLRTRQWTDQQGNKRATTEIQVDNIQLLGKRPDAPQGQGVYQGQGSYQGQGGGYAPQPAGNFGSQPQANFGAQPQGNFGAQPQGGYQGPGYTPAQPGGSFGAQSPQPAQPAAPAVDSPEDDLPF